MPDSGCRGTLIVKLGWTGHPDLRLYQAVVIGRMLILVSS